MQRVTEAVAKCREAASRLSWSGGNQHPTPSEDAEQASKIDQYKYWLLQDGTVWNEEELLAGLRRSEELEPPLREAGTSPPEKCRCTVTFARDQHKAVDRERESATRSSPQEGQQYEVTSSQQVPDTSSQMGSEIPLQDDKETPVRHKQDTLVQEVPGVATKEQWDEEDNVIIFSTGPISPWDSDIDTQPIVQEEDSDRKGTKRKDKEDKQLTKQACDEILQKGLYMPVQGWHARQRMTVHVVTDSFLAMWSDKDRKYDLVRHEFANLKVWTQHIRAQNVHLQWRIQDFPKEGALTYYLANFS